MWCSGVEWYLLLSLTDKLPNKPCQDATNSILMIKNSHYMYWCTKKQVLYNIYQQSWTLWCAMCMRFRPRHNTEPNIREYKPISGRPDYTCISAELNTPSSLLRIACTSAFMILGWGPLFYCNAAACFDQFNKGSSCPKLMLISSIEIHISIDCVQNCKALIIQNL